MPGLGYKPLILNSGGASGFPFRLARLRPCPQAPMVSGSSGLHGDIVVVVVVVVVVDDVGLRMFMVLFNCYSV